MIIRKTSKTRTNQKGGKSQNSYNIKHRQKQLEDREREKSTDLEQYGQANITEST